MNNQNKINSCECDKACTGNIAQICGGIMRNSIYKIYCIYILNNR